MSGMHGLSPRGERTAAGAQMLLEQRPEMADQTLDGLGGAGRVRAERVRADEAVELIEQVDVGRRSLAALEPLQDLDAERQAVATRRAEPARLAREEPMQIERALERVVVLAEYDERARAEAAPDLLERREVHRYVEVIGGEKRRRGAARDHGEEPLPVL